VCVFVLMYMLLYEIVSGRPPLRIDCVCLCLCVCVERNGVWGAPVLRRLCVCLCVCICSYTKECLGGLRLE